MDIFVKRIISVNGEVRSDRVGRMVVPHGYGDDVQSFLTDRVELLCNQYAARYDGKDVTVTMIHGDIHLVASS